MQAFINPLPPAVWGDAEQRAKELAKQPADVAKRIGETIGEMTGRLMNQSAHVPAMLAATCWLRDECPTTRGQKIGAVGFCMGGGLSALLACHDPDLAAAVIFYGMLGALDRVPEIRCPVLGLYGELDARVNGTIAPLTEAMARAGKRYEPVIYPGAQHAFFNDNRPSYDVRAARDALVRTLDLFRGTLGG